LVVADDSTKCLAALHGTIVYRTRILYRSVLLDALMWPTFVVEVNIFPHDPTQI
jgi:hypothetical protein